MIDINAEKQSMDRQAALMLELSGLHEKQAAILEELPRSLAIQELWPEAFDNGRVRSRWRSINYTTQQAAKLARLGKQQVASSFTVIDGAGNERVFEPHEVPAVLNTHNLFIPEASP